jgi:homoserine kinase type II
MSVYTHVGREELSAWLTRHSIGELAELTGIASGIENTNYFVDTTEGRYVLTLYERLPAEELPFYLNLMAHLSRSGVPCPTPMPDRSGALFSLLNGKPASLFTRLSGEPVMSPTVRHCAAAGSLLGRLHLAAATFRPRMQNRRGMAWWRQAARAVHRFLTPEQVALLESELEAQAAQENLKLPRGAIHADLFRDNVFFTDGTLSGVIDFGFAATDFLMYDVAITVNDWCSRRDGQLDERRTAALLRAYHALRPIKPEEQEAWPLLLRAAALRFWLSRLYDLHLPRPGELTHAHDPVEFERILRARAEFEPSFPVP